MHPYDVKLYIEWVIHLVGYILLAGWFFGVVAVLLAIVTDSNLYAFFGLWPLILGLWLIFTKAPEPAVSLVEEEGDEPTVTG